MSRPQPNWDNYYSTLKRMPKKLKKTAQFIVDAIPDFKKHGMTRLLDLGCGAGRHCILLASNGLEVIGMDISKNALRMAKRWVRKERLGNVGFVRATMTNIPLIDRCLDAVVTVSVMHHAFKKNITTSVGEVYRILDRNGWFLANLASVEDPRYGTGKMVEKNTFLLLEGYEEHRFEELHHFFTKQEALKLLRLFSKANVTYLGDKPNYWKILAIK